MKGGEHGALGGRDELGKGGWNLGLCSALKLPASLPGPQLCGAKGGPHGGDGAGTSTEKGSSLGGLWARPPRGHMGGICVAVPRALSPPAGRAGHRETNPPELLAGIDAGAQVRLAHRPQFQKSLFVPGGRGTQGPWRLFLAAKTPSPPSRLLPPSCLESRIPRKRDRWLLPRDNQRPHPGHPAHHIPAQDSPALLQEEPQRPGADPQRGGLQLCGNVAGHLHVLHHELRASASEPSVPMFPAPTSWGKDVSTLPDLPPSLGSDFQGPQFPGGQPSQLCTLTWTPAPAPALSWELWPCSPSLAMRPGDL